MNKQQSTNSKIKVPIFSSEIIEKDKGMFESPSYPDLIDYLKKKIDVFNTNKSDVRKAKMNKVKEIKIDNISYIDSTFEMIPTLLLKISASNTNLIDGFVEVGEKIKLEKEHKVGSDNNFVLVYPFIYGDDSSTYKCQYKFFVYDDPTKETSEIISIVKLIADRILNIKIRNLKLESILSELKQKKVISNLELNLSSHKDDNGDDDLILHNYVVESKIKKIQKTTYENIPVEKFEELLQNKDGFFRRVLKFGKGNKEIRITEDVKNDLSKFSQSIEEIFNTHINFDMNDLEKMFDNDFIIRNLNSVVKEFTIDAN